MARQYIIRDTAKDIILGTAPSGVQLLRKGREGRTLPTIDQGRSISNNGTSPIFPQQQPFLNSPVNDNRALEDAIGRLQKQLTDMQQRHADQMAREQESRRHLEQSLQSANDAIAQLNSRQLNAGRPNEQSQLQSQSQARAVLEAQVMRLEQDIAYLRGIIDRHSNDIMAVNNEVRQRPIIDPSQMNSSQILEGRVRELYGNHLKLQQSLDNEISERRRINQNHDNELQRVKTMLQNQDERRNDLLNEITKKSEVDEETRRLNDKIHLITDEVTKSLLKHEQNLREEGQQKHLALEKAIKAELESRLQFEHDVRQYLTRKWNTYNEETQQLREAQKAGSEKAKEKLRQLNEAITVIEQHLEQGNRKIDRVVAAEIQARMLHEKGLLAKLTQIEDRLGEHYDGLHRSVEEVRQKKMDKSELPFPVTHPIPHIDVDELRQEMESISGDKQKITLEGLLKIDQKMRSLDEKTQAENKRLNDKLDALSQAKPATPQPQATTLVPLYQQVDPEVLAKLRHQVQKLEDTQTELEKSQARMRDKIDRYIPQTIEELRVKQENMNKQLSEKLGEEISNRVTGDQRLTDEINELRKQQRPQLSNAEEEALKKDVNESKIGIRKLAEAVTTVKNVLSRRIDDETKTRQQKNEQVETRLRQIESATRL